MLKFRRLFLLVECFVVLIYALPLGTYNQIAIELKSYSNKYQWNELQAQILDEKKHKLNLASAGVNIIGRNASEVTGQSVYVSLTTHSGRIDSVDKAIVTMLNGVIYPTKIYLFVSRDKFFKDQGVNVVPEKLAALVAAGLLTIVFTENLGPHKKLLPLLSHLTRQSKGSKSSLCQGVVSGDCNSLIVTIDDDMALYSRSKILYSLLHSYVHTGKQHVAALRVRRIGLCPDLTTRENGFQVSGYRKWEILRTIGRVLRSTCE